VQNHIDTRSEKFPKIMLMANSDKSHFFQFENSQTADEEMGSRMAESAENML
jgi:hypothetical protein